MPPRRADMDLGPRCSSSPESGAHLDMWAPFARHAGERELVAFDPPGAGLSQRTLPWSRFLHSTPGVSHDNPTYRWYHGAAVFGTDARAGADELLGSAQVAAHVADQHTAVTAVHAFSVERSVPVNR